MMRPRGSSGQEGMRGGALTLLTLVVVIALAVLAVLSVTTARAMLALSQRRATMTTEAYQAEQAGQAFLAALDDHLQEGSPTSAAVEASSVAGVVDGLAQEVCPDGVTATAQVDATQVTATFTTASGRRLDVAVDLGDKGTWAVSRWELSTETASSQTGDTLWTGTGE